MEGKKTEVDSLKEVAEKVNVLVEAEEVDGDLPF
jgi:hypothetical protein